MADIKFDAESIQQLVDQAVQKHISELVTSLGTDPVWLDKIERQINQAVVQRTVASLGQTDITPILQQRADESMNRFRQDILSKFSSTGIDDRATQCQLTVMDDVVVIENQLAAKSIEVMDTAVINHLAVKGSINVNNRSWQTLADSISDKTLEKINEQWQDKLVKSVQQQIVEHGIDFLTVTVGGQPLVSNNTLASTITDSRLQSVGQLHNLTIRGELQANNTMHVLNRRVGINTDSPEMALSVWDEEVSITVGKFKLNQGWVGTTRNSGLAIGTNRVAQVEIDVDGLTTVKQLRVGLHRIGHATQVPGYAGTRGDLVFNSNLGADRVFAWMCLGGHKWQTLKSAE
jgi:hypothetical protein